MSNEEFNKTYCPSCGRWLDKEEVTKSGSKELCNHCGNSLDIEDLDMDDIPGFRG